MNKNQSTILIIFGISGDLARRYLLPALGAIAEARMLPKEFRIVGITRQADLKLDSLLKKNSGVTRIRDRIDLYKMDTASRGQYLKFKKYLENLEKSFRSVPDRLFYLSIPPEACPQVVEMIGQADLNKKGRSKLLLEKPFGVDFKSASHLIKHANQYFRPEEVYRIDHYLAKEATQNIIVFRDGNSLFKKTWNKDFIESVEIIASEEIGIEGRAHFYEQTGALRDYVQSHLLQLSALVLMDLPPRYDLSRIPSLRLKALKHLRVTSARRGQYEGYKEEVKNPRTTVETFASVTLKSGDPRWKNVPITVTTGKALGERFTEIRIRYKKNEEHESNELLLRLQPDAGIRFSVWTKRPGYERELKPHVLSFSFKDHYGELPEAYEQVLFSAINGDHSLFASGEEVLESWRILDSLQKTWKKSAGDLLIYKKGSGAEEIMNNTIFLNEKKYFF